MAIEAKPLRQDRGEHKRIFPAPLAPSNRKGAAEVGRARSVSFSRPGFGGRHSAMARLSGPADRPVLSPAPAHPDRDGEDARPGFA